MTSILDWSLIFIHWNSSLVCTMDASGKFSWFKQSLFGLLKLMTSLFMWSESCAGAMCALPHSVSRWRSNGGGLHVRLNFSGVSHVWMSDGISQGSHMLGCQMIFFVGLTCLDVRWNLDDVWHVWHLLSHSMISIDLAAQAASPATLVSPPLQPWTALAVVRAAAESCGENSNGLQEIRTWTIGSGLAVYAQWANPSITDGRVTTVSASCNTCNQRFILDSMLPCSPTASCIATATTTSITTLQLSTSAMRTGHWWQIVYWEGCPPGPMTRIMEEEGFLNPSLDFFEIVLTTKIWWLCSKQPPGTCNLALIHYHFDPFWSIVVLFFTTSSLTKKSFVGSNVTVIYMWLILCWSWPILGGNAWNLYRSMPMRSRHCFPGERAFLKFKIMCGSAWDGRIFRRSFGIGLCGLGIGLCGLGMLWVWGWLWDSRCQLRVQPGCQMSDVSHELLLAARCQMPAASVFSPSILGIGWKQPYLESAESSLRLSLRHVKNGSGSTRALSAKFKSLAVLSLCVLTKALMQTWLLIGHV